MNRCLLAKAAGMRQQRMSVRQQQWRQQQQQLLVGGMSTAGSRPSRR
jgi:hypothetical protein